jgi:predicted NACHT family NTPase
MKSDTVITTTIVTKLYSSATLEELKRFEKKDSLNTGISYVDNDFGFPSGYYVILGNPGTGKSWFALWLSRMFYRHDGMKSVYFTLEMPEPMVRKRILQQWSDITKSQLESGTPTHQATDLMSQDVIVVDDFYAEEAEKQTPENFEVWIRTYYQLGYRIFHFDHLHELLGSNDNAKNQKVTETWAKCFQNLCKKYTDIWLMIYAQPNGASANKKILRRTDISGSKAITMKCDYFLSLNRNIDIDEKTGVVLVDENERNIILYLDKTRYTEKTHIGFRIHFSETGNFYPVQG